jgi:hypothetical protein
MHGAHQAGNDGASYSHARCRTSAGGLPSSEPTMDATAQGL